MSKAETASLSFVRISQINPRDINGGLMLKWTERKETMKTKITQDRDLVKEMMMNFRIPQKQEISGHCQ
jgi:hypothetical protein